LFNINTFNPNKFYKTMILAALALAIGGIMMAKIRETEELYAPKGYLTSLQSRPRNVYYY
jgi:hypothetical protein